VIIDAREVRAKARRPNQKSDSRDAYEICDGLRRGIYSSSVHVPEAGIEKLRQILSRRRHFIRIKISQVNAAKHQLRAVGLGNLSRTLTTAEAWSKLLDHPALRPLKSMLSHHADIWRLADEKVDIFNAELEKAIEPYRTAIERLQSVPGVGPITAATFVAVVADPKRFQSSAHLASYAGLVPSTYDSGGRERHGRITRRGSAELRTMLVEAAQQPGGSAIH
jgi:Transposase and inactivated derivatives